MYASVLAGHVAMENWDRLEQSFSATFRHPPHGLAESFLMHSSGDPHSWRLVCIWSSREDYELAHRQGLMETCTQLFCEGGSMPELTAHHVVRHFLRTMGQEASTPG
jgi:hypothetical protein